MAADGSFAFEARVAHVPQNIAKHCHRLFIVATQREFQAGAAATDSAKKESSVAARQTTGCRAMLSCEDLIAEAEGNVCHGQMSAEAMARGNSRFVAGNQFIKYRPRLVVATHQSEDPAAHILCP